MKEWMEWLNPLSFGFDKAFPPLENAVDSIPILGDPFDDEPKTVIGKLINWKTGLIVGGLIYAWIRYRGGDQ